MGGADAARFIADVADTDLTSISQRRPFVHPRDRIGPVCNPSCYRLGGGWCRQTMRVLLIEDHRLTRELVTDHLRTKGFAVDAVQRGEEAIAARAVATYDAVILDLGLPDVDGRDLLPRLRSSANDQPILVLTARDSVDQRIGLLNEGADDFIRKPFHLPELEARLRAVLRRPGARRSVLVTYADLQFDTVTRAAQAGTRALTLSRLEAMALERLMLAAGDVVPRAVLEQAVYALDDEVTDNALEAVTSRLRRRLAQAGSSTLVESVRGVGYRLRPAGAA